MILVEQNEYMNPKVTQIRKQFTKIISDRHEDAMAKFGCALALGIIDAGGRNCTIGLQTQTGNLNMSAIVGMAVFTQYWYWFPLTHFLSLSFIPTAIIGVDQDLEIPEFKFHSNTRPSMFDYPPEAEVKAVSALERIKIAILSTTAQAKRRKQAKEAKEKRESGAQSMELDTPIEKSKSVEPRETSTAPDDNATTPAATPVIGATGASGKEGSADKDTPEASGTAGSGGAAAVPKKKAERVGYELGNMSRVLPAQLKYISFPGERYVPVKKPTGGVILLHDTQPEESKSLLELKVKKARTQPAPQSSSSAAAASGTANTNANGQSSTTPVTGTTSSPDVARQIGSTATATTTVTGAEARTPASGRREGTGLGYLLDGDEEAEEDAEVPEDFEYFTDDPDAMEE